MRTACHKHELLQKESGSNEKQGLTLVLSSATDNVGIGSDGSLHLWVAEVDDGSIILEEVHLFDSGNIVHTQAFQSILQTLIIRGTRVCAPLRLSSHTSFTSSSGFLFGLYASARFSDNPAK